MNLKTIALTASLIAAPVGAAVTAKNIQSKKAQVVEKAPEYELSAQDYRNYVLPQVANSTNDELLANPIDKLISNFLDLSDEKRDSILNEVDTKAAATAEQFETSLDSIVGAAKDKIEAFLPTEYLKTDLDQVLIDASVAEGSIIELYNGMNEIDKSTNGNKAVAIALPEKKLATEIDEVLGMNLNDFKSTYARELRSLKGKKIPFIHKYPNDLTLTEREWFVLDKIQELDEALINRRCTAVLDGISHSQNRIETTFYEIDSAMNKLNEFSDSKDYSFNLIKFLENETPVVGKPFVDELIKLSDTETGICDVKAGQKPKVDKIVKDNKIIVKITNPDGSVVSYTTSGIKTK